ncbi:hypothetical protein pdam_00001439 [Pocillopora damicornis]|uniref:Uncharacterized protein n=1 Tax=Pocillopora damicornis TaxID=46731 RepID=A0A3M6V3S9_POCDA|nr:hypothetical protein pdam_00001439 [Pocillopora damicornis]
MFIIEPSLITTPDDQIVIEGTKVTFLCNASGNPSPKITWSKDGKTLTEGETLSFEANRNQSGEYWCSAENGLSVTVNASAHLDVQFPPSFTTTPSDLTVQEDNEARFHCSATGNPPLTITWMKDGKTVVQGDELRFTAKRNQSGEYLCSADNGLGVNITASASLDVQFAPSLISTPADQTVIEGTKTSFFCNASGNPSPKITWSKDGEILTEGETLSFEANRNQSGEYWCSAENGLRVVVNASAHLVVQYALSFTSIPGDQTIEEGDEATFKCSATGNPAPEITWIKDGKTVGLGETLQLTSVDRNQSGEYVCSVDNVLGFNIDTSAKLDVQFSPSVVEAPTNKTIFEGETATFHCKATGNPAPEITWTKNGKTVGSGETLSFETSRNQSGKYLCSANNGIDKSASASAYLDVHYPLSLTTTPSDQTVREGETAEFHCSATGNPPPKVIWMKDGKVVGQGDKLSFESSKNRSGKYWCMARNELGLTINASALLDVQFSPVIDTEPVSKTVTEGTMVKFFCNATGNPLPEITWIRNGETVAQGETISFETNRNQSGEYRCLVENGMSPNASASANLDVQFPPEFTRKPADQTVTEGNKVTFHCAANGNPAPEIKWVKGETTLALGGTLTFEASRNHSGTYLCVAENGLDEEVKTSANLDVLFPPTVTTKPINKTVTEGTKATFYCNATGNPIPKITWMRDGVAVAQGDIMSFETNRNQSGEYWCLAENGLSPNATASANLDVQLLSLYSSIIYPELYSVRAKGALTTLFPTVPPEFTTKPADKTVTEGNSVRFHCATNGNPSPNIKWVKGENTVGFGDSLTFEASRNHSGRYMCLADNGLDMEIKATANLDVLYGPSLTTRPTDQTVVEGATVTFSCYSIGNPVPDIVWIKDGKTVAVGNILSFETSRNQSGKYWCSAKNDLKTVNASVNLDVQFPPSFTSKPVDQTVKEGDETTLRCTATGNPTPNITWIKDGMAVAFGETFKFSANRTKSGTYWCSVENGLNVAVNTSASLDVQFPPSCVVTPKSHSVIEGHDASFLCSATGNPTPDLTWYKDGMVVASGDTLTFTANRNQSGQYWCSAENIFNETVRASGNLEVHFKPEKTRLTVTPDVSDRVKFGSSVKFTCTAESRPTVEVYNFYRDQLLLGSNISGIYEVQLQRSGRYSCVPVNRAGNGTESSINIAVDVQKPYFPELVPPVYLFKDSQARLPCKPAGEPQPTVKWFKDGVAISYGQNASYRLQANGTLIIDKVENGNAGKYTCMAENFLGKANITARGILLERTKIFMRPPQSQTVSQGTNVELKCSATADPSLELRYIWKKDGIEVVTSSKPENVLRISNISVDEAGIYTCVAFTPEPKRSEDSVSAIVSIIGVPPPPENLQITDCYDRAPILSWTPVASNNAPITQYLIYQESNHNPTVFKLHNVTDPNVTSFQLSLPGWTSLRFRVRAVNDFGAGRPSLSTAKGACETPSVAPENPPNNLRGVPGNANELVIYWDPMPKDKWNAQGFYYVIQYRRVNGRISEWRDEKIADPGVNMFDLSNPGYYQLWEFTIRAGNNEGSGPASSVKRAHSGQNAPVVKPESSEVGTVSDDSVTLSWEPVTVKRGSIDGYRIYYWGEPLSVISRRKRRAVPSTAEKFEVIGGSNTQATITGLKPFSAYSAAVKAFNSGGEGPESPIINFETSESEPGPPSDVFIDAFGEVLLIRWTPPQEPNGIISGYRVGWAEYDVSSPESVVLSMEEVEVTVRTILLKNKKSETSYVVEVQAKTSKGWGRAPAKPLKPTVKQIPGKNAFNVTYNFAVGGGWTLEFKVLYRKEAEGETYQVTAWVDHSERRWTEIEDLKPDKYEFKTVARNKVGMSAESDLTFADLENAETEVVVVIIGAIVVLLIVIVVVVKQCRKRRSENLHESDKEKEASQENPKPIDFKPREDWRTRLERVDEADSESHDSLDEYGGGGAYFSEDGSFVGEFDAKKSDTPHEQVQDPAV